MKRNSLIVLSTLILLATGLLLIWRGGEKSRKSEPREVVIPTLLEPDPGELVSQDFAETEVSEPESQPMVEDLTRASFSNYLAENDYSPDALAGVFDITGNEAMLRSAIERFPNDPALLARGAFLSTDTDFALSCAEKLREVSPANPVGDYLTAALLLKVGGDLDAIKDLLAEGLSKGTLDMLDADAVSSRREALESAGIPEFDARNHNKSLFGPIAMNVSVLQETAEKIAASGDFELLELGVGMTQHFLEGKRNSLINQLAGANAQQSILEQFRADYVLEEFGVTAAERIEQIEEDVKNLHAAMDQVEELVGKLTASQWRSYSEAIIADGEPAALMGLLQKLPKSQK